MTSRKHLRELKKDSIDIILKDSNHSNFCTVEVCFISKLTCCIAVPLNIAKPIERILYKFVWGGKDKSKCKKVIQKLKQSGLNMVDIRSIFRSFKAVLVSRIFQYNPCVHGWVLLAHHYVKCFLICSEHLIFNFDDTVDFCEI